MACAILVPQPGIEPRPSAVRVWSSSHWPTREFSLLFLMSLGTRGYLHYSVTHNPTVLLLILPVTWFQLWPLGAPQVAS